MPPDLTPPRIIIPSTRDQEAVDTQRPTWRFLIEQEGIGVSTLLIGSSGEVLEAEEGGDFVTECPTRESVLAWAAIRAREIVREEGNEVRGNALSGWDEIGDARVYPPRANKLLKW